VLLLATAKAAATTKVRVPGYNVPMTHAEHLQSLQRQIQHLQDQLHAQAIPAQWRVDRAIMAATANVAETAMASSSPVPANANEPSWEEHIRSQPGASIATSNSATYAQVAAMNSAPPSSPTVKRSTRTKDNGRDHSANAASASAAAGPEPARSPSVQRHEPAENPAAAALQAAADAATIAAKRNDHEVLRAVLRAAATTANALAQAAPQDMVPTHRRGGRPPPTRRKPRAWPRRTQRPALAGPGTPAPTATGISTAKLPKLPRWTPSQHPTTASSPPEGRTKSPPADRNIYRKQQMSRARLSPL
jgi:hypothetical protein